MGIPIGGILELKKENLPWKKVNVYVEIKPRKERKKNRKI